MAKGFFKIHRQIFRNGIWKSILEFRLFLWLIGNAVFSHEGINYGDVQVKRGQYLRSYRKLQNDLSYIENHQIKTPSLSAVKRAIDKLISKGMIITLETELGTLFSIINYEKYQSKENGIKESEITEATEIDGHETPPEQMRNSSGTIIRMLRRL